MMRPALAVIAAAVAVGVAPAWAASATRVTPVVQVAEKVSPAVVNISTEENARSPWPGFDDPFFDQFFRDFFESGGRGRTRRSLGSGVVVDPRGFILTNAHVVARADRITVTLKGKEPQEATLVGYDRGTDLGVIRIKGKGDDPFPSVPLARSDDLMIGETVIAIGNPFGLSHTVSVGVISALDRSLRLDEGVVFRDFIQTDAPINPGNSGGPLLTIDGDLVGITTAIYQKGQGIGFAIPGDRAKRVMESLVEFKSVRPSFVGIVPQAVTSELAAALDAGSARGVLVADVIGRSPAERGGVKRGDLVTGVGGSPVQGVGELLGIVDSYPPGSELPFTIVRGGKETVIRVTGEAYSQESALETVARMHGLTLTEGKGKGLAVAKVEPLGSAREAGLRAGDLLISWGEKKLTRLSDIAEAVGLLPPSRPVPLMLIRGGERYRTTLPSPGP
jgi:serine protease Do